MVYLLYWLITPRKTPRVRVHDGNQETWSRLSHQNHSPSLLPWFVTPSGALSSQMPSCGMDTVVRPAAVGYHQPPAGTAVITWKVVRARVCQNAARRWISCRSRGRYLSYCSFRRIRRSPPGRALASLPWRPARETEAHDHMGRTQASWTQWPARAAWFRLRERRGGTHRHGRVSMSCARCRQSKTLFPEATSCTKAKTLDPLSSDTTVRLVLRLGCGARALRDRGKSLEHDGKAQPAH